MATYYLFLLFLCQQTIVSGVTQLSIIEGEPISVNVCMSIEREDAVNWFKDREINTNKLIVNSANRQSGNFSMDGTSGNLVIKQVNRKDAGLYTCQVVEKAKESHCIETYDLNVYYMDSPILTSYTENYIFYCEWAEIYPDIKPDVQWIYNGEIRDTKTTKYNVITTNKTSMLMVHQVSENDFGNYACRITVETRAGNMSKTSKVGEIKHTAACSFDESSRSVRRRSLDLWLIVIVCAAISFVCIIGVLWSAVNRRNQTSEFSSSITGPENEDDLPVPLHPYISQPVIIPDVCDGMTRSTTMATIETDNMSLNWSGYDEVQS
ncbi:uncharacterized protein [Antedon mediterranea]|uniref:uncharacterized protein n=1 Tax=Antedon mediterranea TaxID=105859 RepID=UPI003AF590D9